eukprot:TRINITY_DN2888_c0_g1_i1.p1 TRINITY_DN2888_c0_g1~~TRINITY_DN2888_c0_g1_i1.p1  ORF type:complete len:327 (-),score=45.02 TRINITY_DN2888_c0_g1_i1:46-1026(-)
MLNIEGRIILIVATTLYSLLLVVDIALLIKQIIDKPRNESTFTLPVMALSTIALFLLNRIVYFALIISDTFEIGGEYIITIFSELPALLFMTVFSLVLFTWIDIVHFSMEYGSSSKKSGSPIRKMKIPVITLNVFMYLLLTVLIILHATLPYKAESFCNTPIEIKNALSPQEVVSVVYFVFFSVISLVMLLAVIYYWRKLLIMFSKFHDMNKESIKSASVLMMMACLGLKLQAFNLISRLTPWRWSFFGAVLYLLIADVVPTLGFMYIFRRRKTTSRKSRSTSSGKSTVTTTSNMLTSPRSPRTPRSSNSRRSSSPPPPEKNESTM